MRIFAIVATLLLLVMAKASIAGEATECLEYSSANQAYLKGDYKAASDSYKACIERGFSNPEIYYNAANSFFKLGIMGETILYYERAHRLRPRDADINYNLGLARSRIEEMTKNVDIVTSSGVFKGASQYVDWFRLEEAEYVFFLFYYLSMALLAAYWIISSHNFRNALFFIMLFTFTSSAVSGLFLGMKIYTIETEISGVLKGKIVTVRDGPNPSAKAAFDAPEGIVVQVESEEDNYVRVRLLNGMVGWVKKENVSRL